MKKSIIKKLNDMKLCWSFIFVNFCPNPLKIKPSLYNSIVYKIKPGDVIFRSFDKYLTSYLIKGEMDHSAIYLGDGIVIHAVLDGVKQEHLIDYMMADHIWVYRYPRDLNQLETEILIKKAKSLLGTEYDYGFQSGVNKLYCHEFIAACYKTIYGNEQFMEKKKHFFKNYWLAESFNFKKILEI